mmetsp:Transcript_10146/g.18520  ORF Transcript_10146/g.18520 Transcript_10146/m.18520 type:complete len:164 (-) Transcript_10146:180-671(-)
MISQSYSKERKSSPSKMKFYVKNSSSLIMLVLVFLLLLSTMVAQAFTISHPLSQPLYSTLKTNPSLFAAEDQENQVVELVEDDEASSTENRESQESETKEVMAPFLSQGEVSKESMEMDWSDPKQARVMFYIILSLIPVLFLIPLMLGSRDLIPMDALPPVDM